MIQAVTFLILASIFCSVQAINPHGSRKSLLLAVPFALNIGSASGFTRGFFSMFGRGGQQKPSVSPQLEEMSTDPRGPVSFSASQSQNFFPYPFQYNSPESSGFYQQYPEVVNAYLRGTYQHVPNEAGEDFDRYRDGRVDDVPASMNTEDVESFFTLLAETDEHNCISRLVCEMGADPGNAGEFAQSVNEVFGTLHYFPPGSKVSHFKSILEKGRQQGLSACSSDFATCDQESYDLVKNMQTTESEESLQQ